jgi:hypothetical protein
MIQQAIIVLFVILIFSNILLSLVNYVMPPCDPVKEYISNAKKLPDGQLSSLGSIQSGTNTNYVGFKLVETGTPGVIGVKSRNSDYDIQKDEDIENRSETLLSTYDSSIVESIKKMYPGSNYQVQERKRELKQYGDTNKVQKINMFEVEMEGISADNSTKRTGSTSRPSEMGLLSERDGYS